MITPVFALIRSGELEYSRNALKNKSEIKTVMLFPDGPEGVIPYSKFTYSGYSQWVKGAVGTAAANQPHL